MRALKRLIQGALAPFGLRLARDHGTALAQTFRLLKSLGMQPKHIVDVGANHGEWSREAINFFPDAHYTLVEPQPHCRESVQDLIDQGRSIRWVKAAAGDAPCRLAFEFSERDDSSRIVGVDGSAAAGRVDTVQVRTVNDIVAESGFGPPDIIAIDTEGFDLKVLAGCSDFFGTTELFFAEVAIAEPKFKNTLARMSTEMERIGYRPFAVTEYVISPRSGILWLLELAYIKRDSRLLANAQSFE